MRGKLLKPSLAVRGGYPVVGVLKDGKIRVLKVHRLVLEAFVGPARPESSVGRHLDGDPTNNRLENLAWGTMAENSQDMVRHGRSQRGSKSPVARLTEEKVRQARRLYADGMSQEDIAARLGVVQGTVSCALRGVSWAWVKDAPIPKMRPVGQGPGPRYSRRGPRGTRVTPQPESSEQP
jgi:hypothetical protein